MRTSSGHLKSIILKTTRGAENIRVAMKKNDLLNHSILKRSG